MTDRLTKDRFLAAFDEHERRDGADSPAWLRAARRQAIDRFAERGLPTPRDEDWKYTSLAPLLDAQLSPLTDECDDRDDLVEELIEPFHENDRRWSRLVFVNGRYSAKLSRIGALPGGARLGSLAEALITDAAMLERHLTTAPIADAAGAFARLNDAFWRDGALLVVPAGVALAEPLEVLYVATGTGSGVDHPRSLVMLEQESQATFLTGHEAIRQYVFVLLAPQGVCTFG